MGSRSAHGAHPLNVTVAAEFQLQQWRPGGLRSCGHLLRGIETFGLARLNVSLKCGHSGESWRTPAGQFRFEVPQRTRRLLKPILYDQAACCMRPCSFRYCEGVVP